MTAEISPLRPEATAGGTASEETHAFKEWSLVCRAMGLGHQALILRKGGIAEGRAGFAFKHTRFYLFPTRYHAQRERLRPEAQHRLDVQQAGEAPDCAAETQSGEDTDPERVIVTLHAEVTDLAEIGVWDAAAALEPFHPWTEEIIRERFDYQGDQRLHLALVRVSRLAQPWELPYEKRFGGCRSWLVLPEPPPSIWPRTPVLESDAYRRVRDDVRCALESHSCVLEPIEPD